MNGSTRDAGSLTGLADAEDAAGRALDAAPAPCAGSATRPASAALTTTAGTTGLRRIRATEEGRGTAGAIAAAFQSTRTDAAPWTPLPRTSPPLHPVEFTCRLHLSTSLVDPDIVVI